MAIITSRIPDGTKLINGDVVIFTIDDQNYHHDVMTNHLSLKGGSNDTIFKLLNINRLEFASACYGYEAVGGIAENAGNWPEFKRNDYEAAVRMVNAIFDLIDSKMDPKVLEKIKADRLERERLEKILPDYKIDPPDIVIETVNVKNMCIAHKLLVAKDLAAKGYLVSIERDHSTLGCGLVGTGIFDRITRFSRDIEISDDKYVTRASEKFFIRKLSDADLDTYKRNIPNVIGKAGGYNVVLQDGRLVIGCQKIDKDNAIKIAQGILSAFKVKA